MPRSRFHRPRRTPSAAPRVASPETPASLSQRSGDHRPAPRRGPAGFVADLVSELVLAARSEFAAGRPVVASRCLKLVTVAGDHPGRAWRLLGQLYFDRGQFESAGRAFGRAAAHHPLDADLQAKLALVCLRLEDIPSFEGYLERAFMLEPANLLGLELLADVARDHGDPALAAELYRQLIVLQPGVSRLKKSLAHCQCRLSARMTVLNLLRRNRTEAPAAPSISSQGSLPGNLGCDRARLARARGDADLPEL